jgi:hypothetical protein
MPQTTYSLVEGGEPYESFITFDVQITSHPNNQWLENQIPH